MEMISSHDIEDKYLTELVSVNKFYRFSTKLEMKYAHALLNHIKKADIHFKATKEDIYWADNFGVTKQKFMSKDWYFNRPKKNIWT